MDKGPPFPPPSHTPWGAHLLLGGGLCCLGYAALRVSLLQKVLPGFIHEGPTYEFPGQSLGLLVLGWAGSVLIAWFVAHSTPSWRLGLCRLGLLVGVLMPTISLVQLRGLAMRLQLNQARGIPEGRWDLILGGWLLGGAGLMVIAWSVCGLRTRSSPR